MFSAEARERIRAAAIKGNVRPEVAEEMMMSATCRLDRPMPQIMARLVINSILNEVSSRHIAAGTYYLSKDQAA